MSKHTFFTNW